MKLYIFIIVALMGNTNADDLHQWLAAHVQRDEQLISDALAQKGGHSLDMLINAKTYVPFFLEVPKGTVFTSAAQKSAFEKWLVDVGQSFLPGGYIYRLRFNASPSLYAVSAGEWDGTVWHSIDLNRDIIVDPKNLWENTADDYLYATLLGGVPPRLIIYNQKGEVSRQESFDAFALDLEQRIESSISPYMSGGKPVMEMISLSEFLQQPNALWRPLDVSGNFNLRNQHQRAGEQMVMKQYVHITRSATIGGLTKTSVTTQDSVPTKDSVPTEDNSIIPTPPPIIQPSVSATPDVREATSTPSKVPTSAMAWGLVVMLIVTTIGLLLLVLKKRK